jgi:hypothetical protein
MNAKRWKKVVKVSLIRGRVEKVGNVRKHNRFCRIFIPFFSVEIRPNKPFVHSKVDGAVDACMTGSFWAGNSDSFQRRKKSGFVTLPGIPSFHDVFRPFLAGIFTTFSYQLRISETCFQTFSVHSVNGRLCILRSFLPMTESYTFDQNNSSSVGVHPWIFHNN